MDNPKTLHRYAYDDYTLVMNFDTFENAREFANQHGGELIEVGFTDGSDNPMPNADGHLIADKRTFRIGLPPEYQVLYSGDPKFQEMAEIILEAQKEKENDVAPEDWLGDQNIAPGDRIIVVKNGEVNTVTTRERIKYLMRGNVYELAAKIPGVQTE